MPEGGAEQGHKPDNTANTKKNIRNTHITKKKTTTKTTTKNKNKNTRTQQRTRTKIKEQEQRTRLQQRSQQRTRSQIIHGKTKGKGKKYMMNKMVIVKY